MRCFARVAGLLVLVAGLLGPVAAAGAHGKPEPPKRVLILVLDQFRPDYVDTFGMSNVRALMRDGADFRNAYLGHMASETVISHNVITSGRLPGRMGWSDEAFRDVDGVLGPQNGMYISGSLGRDQFNALIAHGGYKKLPDYLHAARPGTKFIAVGQKNYAVYSSSNAAGDISVTFSGRNQDCDRDGEASYRSPTGYNVPDYIALPLCGRYYVDADADLNYGTLDTSPAWMYPLDGNRFVPGTDPAHLGGDVWVADAGMEMMAKENWSGMLLTLGAIDKTSHMWGGITDTAAAADDQAHLPYLARKADEQVGRIVQRLRELDQLDETLIVITTDHAGQPSTRFHGVDGRNRGDFNWYYGETLNGTFLAPSPALQPLIDTGNVRFSYQDSAIRTWLTDTSDAAKRSAARVMAGLPDVIASYRLDGSRYRLVQANPRRMTGREALNWVLRGQQLVDTMAAPYASDVVGLLKDDTSYGVAGDHGGHQRAVQDIPIVFAGAGVGSRDSSHPLRSVDILPTVLRAMGIRADRGMDGKAVTLPR
jgi:hypothetical protein